MGLFEGFYTVLTCFLTNRGEESLLLCICISLCCLLGNVSHANGGEFISAALTCVSLMIGDADYLDIYMLPFVCHRLRCDVIQVMPI